jgi:hypothetical protein
MVVDLYPRPIFSPLSEVVAYADPRDRSRLKCFQRLLHADLPSDDPSGYRAGKLPESDRSFQRHLSIVGRSRPRYRGRGRRFRRRQTDLFLDALTFLVAAILIVTLPGRLRVRQSDERTPSSGRTWKDIGEGTTRLYGSILGSVLLAVTRLTLAPVEKRERLARTRTRPGA